MIVGLLASSVRSGVVKCDCQVRPGFQIVTPIHTKAFVLLFRLSLRRSHHTRLSNIKMTTLACRLNTKVVYGVKRHGLQ